MSCTISPDLSEWETGLCFLLNIKCKVSPRVGALIIKNELKITVSDKDFFAKMLRLL